jgi:hypothetical protein
VTVPGCVVVAGFGISLMVLAVSIVVTPARAERFLRGFASSALTHYAEQAIRLVVGLAIVGCAGSMRYPDLFRLFGWIIIASTTVLLLMPWQWHHRFATAVMPPVFKRRRWFALGAFALGALVLYSVLPVVQASP